MDLGFKNAGFKTIWANDNFPEAVDTYRLNIGDEINGDDIEKVDLASIPDADVVIGGFPCQGFSQANMNRKVDDERNILYQYFVKIVETKKPKFFVAENVKGILSIGGGDVIKKIVREFGDVGYRVQYHLHNAADYGAPQSRQRVIILGIRDDLDVDIEFPPRRTHAPVAIDGLYEKHVSIGEALKGIPDPDKKHSLKNHVYTKYKQKFNGFISNRKVDPDKPSPTVTARGDAKGGAMIMNHPFAPSRLSCRELALIQGFPLDFEFAGSMTAIYRQIGNAVPVQFAEAVARTILEGVEKGVRTTDPKTRKPSFEVETSASQKALFA